KIAVNNWRTVMKRSAKMAGKRKRVPEVWVVFALLFAAPLHGQSTSNPTVRGVASIGITVSDMDQAVNFYSKVLSFEKVSDTEVVGEDYEHLDGVFGLRERVVRMKLGDEFVQLTEFLAPRGRPITVDSRSNDLWF